MTPSFDYYAERAAAAAAAEAQKNLAVGLGIALPVLALALAAGGALWLRRRAAKEKVKGPLSTRGGAWDSADSGDGAAAAEAPFAVENPLRAEAPPPRDAARGAGAAGEFAYENTWQQRLRDQRARAAAGAGAAGPLGRNLHLRRPGPASAAPGGGLEAPAAGPPAPTPAPTPLLPPASESSLEYTYNPSFARGAAPAAPLSPEVAFSPRGAARARAAPPQQPPPAGAPDASAPPAPGAASAEEPLAALDGGGNTPLSVRRGAPRSSPDAIISGLQASFRVARAHASAAPRGGGDL